MDSVIDFKDGQSGPFGVADASRVEFSILKKNYVNLTDSVRSNDKKLGADVSVRLIFGKKGAGKTLYLKSIQNYYRSLVNSVDSVYTTEIDNQPPLTSYVVKVTTWFEKDSDKDEVWREIWKLVILSTVYTHLLYSKTLSKKVKKDYKRRLEELTKVKPPTKTATSIFDQLKLFLTKFDSEKNLMDYLKEPEWIDLENIIYEILPTIPPLYFFLDQLDDDLQNAPFHWLKCQYGLYSAIIRLLRRGGNWGRLHIVVCFREVVYSYVLQTPEGSKVLDDPKIKVIKWDKSLLEHFLNKKIETLPDKFFLNEFKTKNAESFFGLNYVPVERAKSKRQDVRSYILRHTMLLPRHIVNIGNIYCKLQENIENEADFVSAIKQAVRIVARNIAMEQLRMAAIFICNKWIYNGAVEQGNLDIFTDEIILKSVDDGLRKLIRAINKDKFTVRTLENYKKNKVKYGFNEIDEPFTALFHAGLLGYIDVDIHGKEKAVFFSESRDVQYYIPYQKKYVFHSSLIDLLGIKASTGLY